MAPIIIRLSPIFNDISSLFYIGYPENELSFDDNVLTSEETINAAIKLSSKHMEKTPDIHIKITSSKIITDLLPLLPKGHTLAFYDREILVKNYKLLETCTICCKFDIGCLPMRIIPELNLVDIKICNGSVNLCNVNHADIKNILIDKMNNEEYKYKCKLALDSLAVDDKFVNKDGFMERFFDQCSEIKKISIPSYLAVLIPLQLSQNAEITIYFHDDSEEDLHNIFSKHFSELSFHPIPGFDIRMCIKLTRLIAESNIPNIGLPPFNYEEKTFKWSDELKIRYEDLVKITEKKNDSVRLARAKAIFQ